MTPAALRALAAAAEALAVIAKEAAEEDARADPLELITELQAAEEASVSLGMLRAARRTGALRMYGRQRSRRVRRIDLQRWLELREPVAHDAAANDVDIRSRFAERFARKRATR